MPWSYKTHTVTLPADTTKNPINLLTDKPWNFTPPRITAPLQGRYRSVTFDLVSYHRLATLSLCEAQPVYFEEHSWRKSQFADYLQLILE